MTATGPDILEVIADLSNDEVFTPPRVANAVLDLLPEDVWTNPDLRWLDPGAKTGVFLREVTTRLLVGLQLAIPDEDKRLEHILTRMVFGVATTELTSLMTRRTVYCSKDASSDHSIVQLPQPQGNIWFRRLEHPYNDKGRCPECGAAASQLDRGDSRENYFYAFIHADGTSALSQEFEMRFDVVIGNPPYQMEADDAGKNVPPIYHHFVEQAIALQPRYIAMITPSRWMGSARLSEFRREMLEGGHLRKIVDYPNAREIFPGVEVKGGVSFFLWDRDDPGTCEATLVRDGERFGPIVRQLDRFDLYLRDERSESILEKVLSRNEQTFDALVHPRDPFGPLLTSNFTDYRIDDPRKGDLRLHMNQGSKRLEVWVDPSFVTKSLDIVQTWKVLVPKASTDGGQSLNDKVLGEMILAGPGSVCSPTYLAVGPFDDEDAARSAESYLRTRFARFLFSLRRVSQNTTRDTYKWVPQQLWDRTWSDDELYAKYGIGPEEQSYIEQMIREMPA